MSVINNINLGLAPNDSLGDKLRDGGIIINQNFASLNADKLERGGYAGTAQDLEDAINAISTTNVLLLDSGGATQQVVNDVLFLADLSVVNTLNAGLADIAGIGFEPNLLKVDTSVLRVIIGGYIELGNDENLIKLSDGGFAVTKFINFTAQNGDEYEIEIENGLIKRWDLV